MAGSKMRTVGFEPTQLALQDLETCRLDRSRTSAVVTATTTEVYGKGGGRASMDWQAVA